MYSVSSRQELRISTLATLPASRGQAPSLAVDAECLELQFLNDLISFQCLNKSLSILCFFSCVHPSGPRLRVTTVVSACTEGMAQLLCWQLLNHHKLRLTVLKYGEIGVYLSTRDCNHGGAAAASPTAEPTLQQG